MTYFIIGFLFGWIIHSVLSWKKYGKFVNKAIDSEWKSLSREKRIKLRVEKLRRLVPNADELFLEESALKQDMEEFPKR